ncbi:MAG TPA: isopentenyl phosphate kinase [Candidatus Nitrosotalea sp.]|nr:isopentenyl phosphate kinase [Candidatus Nitrosotalea sp.]
MILIKLGGSIITNKDKPLTADVPAVKKIAAHLKKAGEPCMLVHGGGSFGHYWSVRYDMHTKPERYSTKGVAVVKNSMVQLNRLVLDALLESGMMPYCLPPTDFVSGNKLIPAKAREIPKIARTGLVPVSYGDVMWYGKNKFYILSGDRIMGMLAKLLRPRLAIFVTNVDGVYEDVRTKKLIRQITTHSPKIEKVKTDVTGGMARKIKEAEAMAGGGTDVFFVNGRVPQRILDAIKGKEFEGTLFRG